jgi:hypothetical protein
LCRQKRRLETKRACLGILEAVEEVGLETFLSDRESTPGSLPSLEGYNVAADRGRSKPASTTVRPVREESAGTAGTGAGGWLSDFDARYLGALDDFDELEDIEPGFLTTTGTAKSLMMAECNSFWQCCGSQSGSVWFWASRISIRIH